VLIDGDDGRKRGALGFLLGPRVELLAEAHDVHAALTQGRADRGRRRGRTGRHLQLDIAENLLGHWSLLWMTRRTNVGPVSRGPAWLPPTDLTHRRPRPAERRRACNRDDGWSHLPIAEGR